MVDHNNDPGDSLYGAENTSSILSNSLPIKVETKQTRRQQQQQQSINNYQRLDSNSNKNSRDYSDEDHNNDYNHSNSNSNNNNNNNNNNDNDNSNNDKVPSLWGSVQRSMNKINPPPGSVRASTFTVITGMIGGGTLTLSYAIKQSGTLMGLIYLLFTCVGAAYTTSVLIYCSEVCNCRSYRRLAQKLYGPRIAVAMQASLIGLLWSACVSYMTLVKTLLTSAIHIILGSNNGIWDDQYILLTISVGVVVLPLALMRKVSALRYSSMAGLFFLCFTCAVVIGLYFEWCGGPPCHTENDDENCEYSRKCFFQSIAHLTPATTDLLSHTYSIAVMLGGFAAHPTVLPIYFEMNKRAPERFKKCIIYGFTFTFFLYLSFAYFGYFTFPDNVDQNLLSSDYRHNPVMLAAATLLCFYVISVVPLFAHAFRKSFAELLLSTPPDEVRGFVEDPAAHMVFVPSLTPDTLNRWNTQKENQKKGTVNSKKDYDTEKLLDNYSPGSLSSRDSLEDTDMDNHHKKKKDKSKQIKKSNNAINNNDGPTAEDPLRLPLKQHVLVTLIFVFSAYGVALVAKNIGQVNALIGSTTLPVCCFVFPALIVWKVPETSKRQRWITTALAVLVCINAVIQLYQQFSSF